MGFLKKIFKPVSKVLDKIVPNEIKPALPYLSAFAPMMLGPGIMGSSMLQRGLMSGGLNLLGQLSQEGSEGDANLLSTLMAGGIGALTAPGKTGVDYSMSAPGEAPIVTEGAGSFKKFADAGIEKYGAESAGGEILGGLQKASTFLTDPGLIKYGIPAAQGTMDLAYAQALRDKRDLERDQASGDDDNEDANRALAIRQSMEAYGFTEEEILDAIAAAGYKAGGRVALEGGGGADWINTHEPGPMGNPAVIEEIENMREWRIANPDVEDVTDYSEKYESKDPDFGGLEEAIINIKKEKGEDLVASRASDFFMLREEAINKGDHDKIREIESDFFKEFKRPMPEVGSMPKAEGIQMAAKGGRINKNEGGMMSVLPRGKEMDYRGGGMIPMGSKERADDVPARLSKNEFVMTADAVRAAGGGSVNEGARRMYNLMNNLEARA